MSSVAAAVGLCAVIAVVALVAAPCGAVEVSKLTDQPWYPKAPALPKPTGDVVKAANVAELYKAVQDARANATILVADGRYAMPRTLVVQKDGVTLRSESGDRAKVILDFAKSTHGEGVAFTRCSGAMLADLTIENVTQNGIKINSDLGASKVTVRNVVGHNVWQRHVKGPKVPDKDGQPAFVEDCRIEFCLFYNDRAKRKGDEPWEDSNDGSEMGFNYVGGIDAMAAKAWTIADNVFLGIHGKTGEARGAIFLWQNCTGCVVERNIIIDCDTGIALGNSSARGERRHCNGVIVRNNFITRCPEGNVTADHTRDCKILHNTVHDPTGRFGRLLRVVHANDGLLVSGNLFSGPKLALEKFEGKVDVEENLVRTVTEYFADAERGDLHLTEKAVDAFGKAAPSDLVKDDIDRTPRGEGRTALGADEPTKKPKEE